MRYLCHTNDPYKAQDVILLCEIMESRFQIVYQKYFYNPRKCNSANSLGGCIQRDLSKVIIAHPTSSSMVEIFEKILTGGFSGVNARLAFDKEILLPNYDDKDFNKLSIDQGFKAFKRDDLKVGYKLKLDGEAKYSDKRIISKVLKLYENNQYGFAMTRPMPTGCIREKTPSWLEFDILLETVDLDDNIGHLFVIDIGFDYENATSKQMMYNEISPPIIDKQKKLDATERSVFQLCEKYLETDDNKPKSYKGTKKSHATLIPKTFIPLYLEDLKFLIFRCGWKVTKIYTHFTFEQEKFKKDFILMNESKISLESKKFNWKRFF